ncbi:MAG: hypothetical protein IPM52_02770 [Bacteroidetes bacterium]|nr:hypothetical protein [Bacteroidota bacterium]
MTRLRFLISGLLVFFLVIGAGITATAWPAHTLISTAALKNHPHWQNAREVRAKPLEQFVIDNKKELAAFLAGFEQWSRENLPFYVPAPEMLSFPADIDDYQAMRAFFMALRINPNVKVPLFLNIPRGQETSLPRLEASAVTTLSNTAGMNSGTYVALSPDMEVDPFLVLTTANDEPDYGFDLGLFDDNGTDYGRLYGFGNQTFGNPNLEYSSQAPFHMGFYHEPGIVYKFAPFLRKTFLDYRHLQYKALSEFAFAHHEPYWGYRFLGWSMHYLADATMPYHIRPLPGYSTLRMLWINFKSMLGFGKARRDAVQLVSNRHTAVEDYLQQRLNNIFDKADFDDPLYQALISDNQVVNVDTRFLVDQASKTAFAASKSFDRAVRRGLPNEMVNDPAVEVSEHPEITNIVSYARDVCAPKHIDALEKQSAERFAYLGKVLRSMLSSVNYEN